MADTAFQIQYRQEYIAAFEYGSSLLSATTVQEAVFKGNTAEFLVAGSGGAEAVTRGVNGMIPDRPDDLTQSACVLTEWHDKPRRTNFNIFASQGDGRRIMQMTSAKVMNRKRDAQIITELDTATNDTGAAVTASLNLVVKARAILGNAEVDIEEEDNMFGLITPAFEAYLLQVKEFGNADYVDVKPFAGPARKMRRWAGVNWIVHPRLPGKATAAEHCFMYHRNSIGHAINTGEIKTAAGYNEENDYYFARTSAFMGAKLLQNSGVVMMIHDGSAYVAS